VAETSRFIPGLFIFIPGLLEPSVLARPGNKAQASLISLRGGSSAVSSTCTTGRPGAVHPWDAARFGLVGDRASAVIFKPKSDQEFSFMPRNSSRRKQARASLDREESERARIVAAFMGLFVEQSIKKIGFDQIAAGADVPLARLREEFGSTIAVLAAHVEQIDRLVLAGENVETAERAHGLAMLLSAVLRTWLDGEDPDLARIMSALARAGAWAAPRGLPRPGLAHSGLRPLPAPAAPAPRRRGHGRGMGPRRDLLQTGIAGVSRTQYGTKQGAAPLDRSPHESYSAPVRPKRPLDTNQLGKWIVDLSTGVVADDHPAVEFRVTELARRGGLKGGKARAAALTPERRREIAQLAAQERWRSPGRD